MTYKIYRIVPCVEGADENDVYYGSTSQQYICNRMTAHRNDYKLWKQEKHHYLTVFSIFEKYGLENCKMELVEKLETTDKKVALQIESEYIMNNKCVNTTNPLPLTSEDYKLKRTQYYREVTLNDPIALKKLRESAKMYNAKKNAEGSIMCECGGKYNYSHKSRHEQTKQHKTHFAVPTSN